MKLPSPKTTKPPLPLPTATFKAEFRNTRRCRKPEVNQTPVARIPRIARLLALAHRIDGMIRSGEIRNWAEAARLIGISRARMSQVANLTLHAPKIQEAILDPQNPTDQSRLFKVRTASHLVAEEKLQPDYSSLRAWSN